MNTIVKLLTSMAILVGLSSVIAAPPGATVIDTNAVDWVDGPAPGITLKRFAGALARMNLVRWADGTTTEPHTHATEQIMYIQSGSYRATVEGEVHILEAGDFIVFPSYSLHGIDALEDSEHIAIFAPAALPQ